MNYESIIDQGLLVVAGINFGIATVLILRNKKDKAHLLFSLVLFFTSIWTASIFLLRTGTEASFVGLSFRLSFVFGTFLSFFLYKFSYIFYGVIRENKAQKYASYILLTLGVISSFVPNFIESVQPGILADLFEYNTALFIIVSIPLVYYFLIILKNLFEKVRKSTGHSKKAITFATFGVFLSIALGSIFDILLPFFGNFIQDWIGPYSTLVMNSIVVKLLIAKD